MNLSTNIQTGTVQFFGQGLPCPCPSADHDRQRCFRLDFQLLYTASLGGEAYHRRHRARYGGRVGSCYSQPQQPFRPKHSWSPRNPVVQTRGVTVGEASVEALANALRFRAYAESSLGRARVGNQWFGSCKRVHGSEHRDFPVDQT